MGVKRQEFEQEMKGAPAGQTFRRVVAEDVLPGGPVEREVVYTAPFDRCDRERDYRTAWEFFKGKYSL